MPRVMNRLHQRLAHQRGGAEHAVEPRERDHLEDGGHAAALLADEPGDAHPGTRPRREALLQSPSLSFRRWMRTRVALPVGQQARQQEAGQARRPPAPAPGARRTSAPRRTTCARRSSWLPSPTGRSRGVVLLRTSEPPCFSVMPMPMVHAGLLRGRERARVVVRRGRLVAATLRLRAGLPQHRHRRVGHRQRARDARVGLVCRYLSAARATCAPGWSPCRQAKPWTSCASRGA